MSDNQAINLPENESENEQRKKKQLLIGGAAVIILFSLFYSMASMTGNKSDEPDKVKGDDLTTVVQRKPGDKDSFAVISRQVNGLMGQMDKYETTVERINKFLDDQPTQSALADLQREIIAVGNQNEELRLELDQLKRKGIRSEAGDPFKTSQPLGRPAGSDAEGPGAIPARPSNSGDLFAPRGRAAPGGAAGAPLPASPQTRSQTVIKLFAPSQTDTAAAEKEAELLGEQTRAEKPQVFDTENYVPPNSYVNARLVVSVDAPIGEASQADPKAAQFIITGPAKHVQNGRRIEETELEGCLVNGSAQGNLSSERVSIKLHAMTCPLSDGRVSVSKVEGYATHLGKNGIRGTVVSREGDLITKAIMAGTLEGLGRTASQGNQYGFQNTNGGLVGERPDAGDIITGSIGSGIAGGANVWSQYLLERARAYEPVISLPTGIEVELVFMSGTLVRPIETNEAP